MIGPDVSEHNGTIDWSKVHGIDFAFCKATEGLTFTDSKLAHNWKGIGERKNLRRGAYHFARPQHGRTGAQEARHFLSALEHVGGLRDDDVLILDLEATQLGPAGTRAHALSFIHYVEKVTNRKVLLYSYHPFFQENVGGSSSLGCKVWLAAYEPFPRIKTVWVRNTILWQFTDGQYGPHPHVISGLGSCDISRNIGNDFKTYGAKASESLGAKLATARSQARQHGWTGPLKNYANQLKARIRLRRLRSRLADAPKDDSLKAQAVRRGLREAIDREKTELRALRDELVN